MRARQHGLAGQLRIAVIPTALTRAARLCHRFNAKHPKVRFAILSRTSVEILSMLDNLDVDAGISCLDNEPMGRFCRSCMRCRTPLAICPSQGPHPEADDPRADQ
jgi:DNA-binding transcriptional LysR family regulator